MHVPCSRREALGVTLAAITGLSVGCQQSNDIPLVKFPEGKVPPPPPKGPAELPQGGNTSKGEPPH